MKVLVTGATSMIGSYLLPRLVREGWPVVATSRVQRADDAVTWLRAELAELNCLQDVGQVDCWIHLAFLDLLPAVLEVYGERLGVKRLIAFSSTSRYTKLNARGKSDQSVANSLVASEERVQKFCESKNIAWTIFRPTMIYSIGQDKNVSMIRSVIQRFGIYPLVGKRYGRRQPVHAEDLAIACVQALKNTASHNKAYNLSGAEILPYRAMVERIFQSVGRRPRIVTIPLPLFRMIISMVRRLPKWHYLTPDMADRMAMDMVFSHEAARDDFGFSPRGFEL